jgi:hypothetical protein
MLNQSIGLFRDRQTAGPMRIVTKELKIKHAFGGRVAAQPATDDLPSGGIEKLRLVATQQTHGRSRPVEENRFLILPPRWKPFPLFHQLQAHPNKGKQSRLVAG